MSDISLVYTGLRTSRLRSSGFAGFSGVYADSEVVFTYTTSMEIRTISVEYPVGFSTRSRGQQNPKPYPKCQCICIAYTLATK